uniref:SAYSvFN domain-containing protein n=1 Tax=Steinernema glaseri TaxID=37863 RepID=A0A1I7ZTY3_9BILA
MSKWITTSAFPTDIPAKGEHQNLGLSPVRGNKDWMGFNSSVCPLKQESVKDNREPSDFLSEEAQGSKNGDSTRGALARLHLSGILLRLRESAMSLRESMKKLEAFRLEKQQREEERQKKEAEERAKREKALLPPKPSLLSRIAHNLHLDFFDIAPFRLWRSYCDSNPRLCWTATFLVWALLQAFMAWIEFGAVFFIVFLFLLMILNLGNRSEGEVSAYSVFNPGCERLLGQMTAEHFESELLKRNRRPAAASS